MLNAEETRQQLAYWLSQAERVEYG